jgi:hypothetical protein
VGSSAFNDTTLFTLRVGPSTNYDLPAQVIALNRITSGFGCFPFNYGNMFAPMMGDYSQLFCTPIVITSRNSAVHMAGFRKTLPAKGFERVWLLRFNCCVEWDALAI